MVYRQVGRHWTAGQYWTVIPFPWKTGWLVSITAMLQVVCILDWSLKFSAPHSRNFLNVPTTFGLLLLSKRQFSNEKIWCFETKLWSKVNSPNVSRDVQKPLFGLCMSQIVTALAGEIWMSFSRHKIALSSKLPLMGQLWATHWLCLFGKNTCTMKQLFSHLEKRGCSSLSL